MPIAANTVAVYNWENDPTDSSGNGYTQVATGAPVYGSTPVPKQGLYQVGTFGAGTYFTSPAGLRTAMAGLTAWCFQSWVYSIGRVANRYIIGSSNGGADKFEFSIGDALSDNARFSVDGTLGLQWTNAADFTGAWHHWACVGKSSGKEIWVDGSKVAFDGSDGTFPTLDTLLIGKFSTVLTSLNAYLDVSRFMNSAPTSFPTTDSMSTAFALLARRRGRR